MGSDASGLLGDPLVDGVVDGREDGLALLLLLRHGSDAAERGDRDDGRGDEAADEPGVVVARLLLLLGAAAAVAVAAGRRALGAVEELGLLDVWKSITDALTHCLISTQVGAARRAGIELERARAGDFRRARASDGWRVVGRVHVSQ